jgi:hypothetical protein
MGDAQILRHETRIILRHGGRPFVVKLFNFAPRAERFSRSSPARDEKQFWKAEIKEVFPMPI